MKSSTFRNVTMAAAAVMLIGGAANAATINFSDGTKTGQTYVEDGFQFVPASLDSAGGDSGVSGQDCPFLAPATSSDPACLKITAGGNGNANFSSTTLSRVDGQAFDLFDFLFEFTGLVDNGSFTVSSANGSAFITANDDDTDGLENNVSYSFASIQDLSPLFTNVFSVNFSGTDGGTLRIDNLMVTPVPAPASALLLLGGLGALALRRRKKSA
ncbi:VPLPA-CTERM sorting domain-containing protein [Loktanella sp. DJP18]|uniref:VPLPA-CTERM sorting domain-containing protein n=1 Tax=Loktanella sp. DJP18 TaxID=3409788 RepID=UPI003BB50A1E